MHPARNMWDATSRNLMNLGSPLSPNTRTGYTKAGAFTAEGWDTGKPPSPCIASCGIYRKILQGDWQSAAICDTRQRTQR